VAKQGRRKGGEDGGKAARPTAENDEEEPDVEAELRHRSPAKKRAQGRSCGVRFPGDGDVLA
jgi:hypothetical protein